MKHIYIITMFIALGFASCKNSEVSKAEDNIKSYIKASLPNTAEITDYKFSKLFILSPLDTDKLPKTSIENTMELHGSTLGLTTSGFKISAINNIIKNDKIFQDYQTGAEEYCMIVYFNVKNEGYENEIIACVRLTKELNVYRLHVTDEELVDYAYLKYFGLDEKRVPKAIKAETKELNRLYDAYVEAVKKETETADYKYYFIKNLNKIFHYEKFKIYKNNEQTLKNCLEKLDPIEDKKELIDIATKNIKNNINIR